MPLPAQHSVRGLLDASHPGPVFAVTVAAMGFALAVGRSVIGVVLVGAAVMAGQFSVGWQNDYLDADRDTRAARLDKPIATGRTDRSSVRTAMFVAGIAMVPLSLLSGWRAGLVHIAAVVVAWSYNFGIKATVWSFLPFLFSFGSLPIFAMFGLAGSPWPPWWEPVAAAMLGIAGHLLNAVPDREEDLRESIVGIAHRLPSSVALVLAGAFLWGSSFVITFAPGTPPWWSVLGLVLTSVAGMVGCVLALQGRGRSPFNAVIIIGLVDVGLLIARIHRH